MIQIAESLGLKDSRGPIVGGIERGSPAEKSGIKLGDVIVAVDGKPTPDVPTALNLIAEMQPGKTVPVNVVRRGQQLTLEVVVGKRRPRPRNTED